MKSQYISDIAVQALRRCLNVRPGYSRSEVFAPSGCNAGTNPKAPVDPFIENPADIELAWYSERPFLDAYNYMQA